MNFSKLVILAACSLLFACGSDDAADGGDDDDGGKGGLDTGFTECGEFTCQPGQHCDNFVCLDGCLSNVNCAADQSCAEIDSASKLGTCQNEPGSSSGPGPDKDCAAFCDKATACGAPEQCQQICDAASSECVSCVIDSNCGQGCESLCGG